MDGGGLGRILTKLNKTKRRAMLDTPRPEKKSGIARLG